MSTSNHRRIDIDLESDLEMDVPPGEPARASLELAYEKDGGRTVTLEHGEDEWILEFDENGRCVDRDPPARQMPGWVSEAVELVKGELR
ncbi:hypothetical protein CHINAEXTREME_08835 [Halobiforma lacisalsi AJ5]|uniref:Uncharacterized protein n=1 Tax=Natronobacterium lacisalsi AJ5 TaxID=358396 RepID=M0L7S9_NATLA|nr:hypothetical protein [Halobiforma lacisalsi]APW97879.1 hypothetical protein CHINAEXTREME_08835 [Halobiforma lacisalsi AJ5]EMA29148.1 hypothetical protein C445_17409 [Halobiforma lacisalsi AJ5]